MSVGVPLRVGFIGLGAIGQAVVRLTQARGAADLVFVAALVRDAQRTRTDADVPVVTDLASLLAARPDVVVEVGGHQALASHGATVLAAGVDLYMAGIGALADPVVEAAIRNAAAAGGSHAIVLSGAIGGLDALAAAAIGGLDRVAVTTRKPAATLVSPAELAALDGPREIFAGTAREAALRFPESVNIAAAVALAGMGFDATQVRILADPGVDRNRHEVVAEGVFGTLRVEIANIPSADNPRSARLVAMSVVHALRSRGAGLRVG